jgi:PEGA domain
VPVAVPVVQSTSIAVDANAPNCDIEVDGNFMGSTPSSIDLVSGKHEIVVKKAGYKDWTRSMTVSSGTIRVNADMVKAQ